MATDPLPDPSLDELLRRLKEHAPSVSRYKLEGEFIRGGQGAIWKVWDEDLRRHLAMKFILGQDESADAKRGASPAVEPKLLARFLEEAQVTGQLDHPGIVPVHELGLDSNGRVFFTMKLVKGRDLKAIFKLVFEAQEGWNETRALSVILRVCEAMAYAHAKGVIHRDLKPANVMVGNFGEVYVMDWGLARADGRKDAHDIRIKPEFTASMTSVKSERRDAREALSDSPIVTMDGDVMGTPAYMSPEQARGEIEKLSPRSDVYALGAMLYHLLAREMPFVPKGARMSPHTVLTRVIEGPPRPLIELTPRAPAELVAIVEKAMARESSARYADTLALAEDLRAFLEHRVVGAYETGAWAEAKKWVQRNKPLAASLICAVVLLVVGLTASLVFKARAEENAMLASRRAAETAEQARIADANAARAKIQEQLAKANEVRATEKEREAKQKANDVLSLSAIQDLMDLEARADLLWPADPELVPQYDAWLADARVLIEGQPATEEFKGQASLAQHEAKLAEIRLLSSPLTTEAIEADRRASPEYDLWQKLRAELQWMRRMLGEEAWPPESEVEASLATERLPTDASGLNALAWALVDVEPSKIVYGNEVRGLLLARRAVAAAKESERAGIRDTLAWALYRCGHFDEAEAQHQQALEESAGQQRKDLALSQEEMRKRIGFWKSASPPAGAAPSDVPRHSSSVSHEDAVIQLSARVSDLQRSVEERRTYEFEDNDARWWHAQLSTLVSDLRTFIDAKAGGLYSNGVSERHGWGIMRRADFARTIEERTVSGAVARRRWDEAIATIAASPMYGGSSLTPQLGLLPIGADPASGLWEFWHVQSGDEPKRGPDGKLILTEKMGIVLVLIPGGTFTLGAQRLDKTKPHYDPTAKDDETPYEVSLDAYFLSKFEMTQGQWELVWGRNPSFFGPQHHGGNWNRAGRPWSPLHPVEMVTWTQCRVTLDRMCLLLPTEAQWEHGNRGATSTVFWSGDDPATLVDVGNVADEYAKRNGGHGWGDVYASWDDGNTSHAEVGSYRANDLGLHDTHGNVWEMCRDWQGTVQRFAPGDGERLTTRTRSVYRVDRGGSFNLAASTARSAARSYTAPDAAWPYGGLRPARSLRLASSQLQPDVK